jgi:hypothetical protein
LDFAAGLTPAAEITVRPGLSWALARADDQVTLQFTERTLRLPGYCEAAVRLALDGEPHRVGDLPLPEDGDRLVLARRLLTEGVLVPAP